MSFPELQEVILETAKIRKEPIEHIIHELIGYCKGSCIKELLKASGSG